MCRKSNPFNVVMMKRDDFKDVEILQSQITKQSVKGSKFSDGRVFVFSEEFKMGFGIKSAYNVDQPYRVKLQKGRGNTYNPAQFDLSNISLPCKYNKPVSLSKEKCEDIQELSNYIPPSHRDYFSAIISKQGAEQTVDDAKEEDENVLDY